MSEQLNDTLDVARAVPRSFRFSKPFWDGTRDRKLLLQYCRATGQYQFYPRPVSLFTGRTDIEWREVSGRGQIFAFTVAHVARPPFAGHTPFLIATVTLDEGVNVVGDIINCPIEQIAIGMRVRPAWAPLPDGTNLLMFQPDDD
ncbi:Zn-ribbon domain-containing OB-fold protein [Novosphingobium sp.]|uniref:Zn-ribbon domain-containing OB-fold protein n=1 Tax=Novosphingobium sp. TaxID=1874826 RepID=UPI002FDA15B2